MVLLGEVEAEVSEGGAVRAVDGEVVAVQDGGDVASGQG